ncbi:LacI family DNA-binding transcriptional regulator [Kineosporia sp. J2-2]|uniref:LacI family DNA-binding transcriptional regulator n=1 Tax=Kineosporia corallincola TaxID=2835133 RepID=A0ABS5TBX8_9ACTN|nr:LacI family DNA-binding transcriptional regulator [Kineosporia corallincola]MBT0768587.1 LacI family DNA-binding transcriptional regulator [Kineosporia corallincola]
MGSSPGTRRPTIAAVAQAAGVSVSAVSHVFNGRTNISPETAQRIRDAADALNWRPNVASRRVSRSLGGPAGGAVGNSIGLVVTQSPETFRRDPFFIRLIAGLTGPLGELGWSLSLTVVEPQDEEQVYRQWWTEQRVDGFLLVDLRTKDPRIPLLRSLSATAVALGPTPAASAVPGVTLDDGAGLEEVLAHLAGLGHRRIARVTSSPGLAHSRRRDRALTAAARQRDLTVRSLAWNEDAADPVAGLLAARGDVSALVLDSEALATRVIAHAPELGVRVPADLSVLSWEDSWVSELVRPRLTALSAPVEDSARTAVDLLRRMVHGEKPSSVVVPGRRLVVRESTGPAPA